MRHYLAIPFIWLSSVFTNAHISTHFKRTFPEKVGGNTRTGTILKEMPFLYGLPICDMQMFGELEKIGQGSFGEVFQLSRKSDHKQFALKKSKEIVSKEIEVLSRLKGFKRIPEILCAGENQTFFIMEKINGVTLRQASEEFLLKQRHFQGISDQEVIKLKKIELLRSTAVQMFSFLKSLHQQDIYPLDGQGGNWMILNDTLELVRIDFGNSLILKSSDDQNFRRTVYNSDISSTTFALSSWSKMLNLHLDDLAPSFNTIVQTLILGDKMDSEFPTIDEILGLIISN